MGSTILTEEIRNQDVLFGRSRASVMHIGNEAFRMLIDETLASYLAANSSRGCRSSIVDQVTQSIILDGGRFLKSIEGSTWIEVDQKVARRKVGHAFRDACKARLDVPSPGGKQGAKEQGTHVRGVSSTEAKFPTCTTQTVASFSDILSYISKTRLSTSSKPLQYQKMLEVNIPRQRTEHEHTQMWNVSSTTNMMRKKSESTKLGPIYIACRGPERSICDHCLLYFAPVLTLERPCLCSGALDINVPQHPRLANDHHLHREE